MIIHTLEVSSISVCELKDLVCVGALIEEIHLWFLKVF